MSTEDGEYTIQLQRIIEAICHGSPLRDDSKNLFHHKMAEKFKAELADLRTNLRQWQEECGKLHSQLDRLKAERSK